MISDEDLAARIEAKRPLREPDDARLTARRLALCNIPRKFWKARLSWFDRYPKVKEGIVEYMENLEGYREQGIGLLIIGPPQLGKTSGTVVIGKEIIRRGCWPHFEAEWDLAEIEMSDDDDRRRRLRHAAFLILDDLGAMAGKEVAKAMTERILRCRYNAGLPTIVSTNLTVKALSAAYGPTVLELLKTTTKTVVMEVGRNG